MLECQSMTKLLAEGVKKIKGLPEEVQDRIGFELIDRAAAWHELREKLMVGIREIDAGLARPLSKKDLLAMIHKRHGTKK